MHIIWSTICPSIALSSAIFRIVQPSDLKWEGLVVAYQATRARWLAIQPHYDAAEAKFSRQLPEKPVRPEHPPLSLDLTLREIKALPPAYDEAECERALEAWRAKVRKLKAQEFAPIETAYETAAGAMLEIADDLARHPVKTLAHLQQKMELLAAEYGSEWTHALDAWPDHLAEDIRRVA